MRSGGAIISINKNICTIRSANYAGGKIVVDDAKRRIAASDIMLQLV
jgi:hypothetical protein